MHLRTNGRSDRWIRDELLRFGLVAHHHGGLIQVDRIVSVPKERRRIPELVLRTSDGWSRRRWMQWRGLRFLLATYTITSTNSAWHPASSGGSNTETVTLSEGYGAGGGGGAAATYSGSFFTGGGGGAYVKSAAMSVSGAIALYLYVGAAGSGSNNSSSPATNGGYTAVSTAQSGGLPSGTVYCFASGTYGGDDASFPGNPGTVEGSPASQSGHSGGWGNIAPGPTNGGGGGGSAGSNAVGSPTSQGSSNSAGSAGSDGNSLAGNGGQGSTGGGAGSNAQAGTSPNFKYGGGGGSGDATGAFGGGNGRPGVIQMTTVSSFVGEEAGLSFFTRRYW